MSNLFNGFESSISSILGLCLLAYILLLIGMFFGQRKLLYHPENSRPNLSDYALSDGSEAVHVPSHDGLLLYSWYRKPKEVGKPLVIYFHGNAGDIAERANRLRLFRDQGFGFLICSYRYNAGNNGKPSEEALIRDGQAIINWAKNKGHDISDIILYGESLGSGIAVSLGQNNLAKAIVLEGPYSSVLDVAADRYKLIPVHMLLKDEFASHKYIENLMLPILIIHGKKDKTIPVKFARKLYLATNGRAQLDVLEHAGHADLYDHGAGRIVTDFMNDIDDVVTISSP